LSGAAAMVVDVLRDHLFSAARFADDHNGRVGRRGTAGQVNRALKGRRSSQKEASIRSERNSVVTNGCFALSSRADSVCRTSDQQLQLGARIWLWKIVPRSDAYRLDARFDARISRHQHVKRVGSSCHHGLEHIDSADWLQVHIDKHDVEVGAVDHLNRFFTAGSDLHHNSLGAENARTSLAKSPIVVDY